MGTLLVIYPDGRIDAVPYVGKEPSLPSLQSLAGGYVEHLGVDYGGKRRPAYFVDPFDAPPGMPKPNPVANPLGSLVLGHALRGPLIIDFGTDTPKPGDPQ